MSSKPFPALTTERLHLRQLSPDDRGLIFTLRSDEQVNRYIERPRMQQPKEAAEFIAMIARGTDKGEWLYWAICQHAHPHAMGTICLWNFSDNKTQAEVGFELLPEFQGKGIMGEALRRVIRYAFTELNVISLEARTRKNNERSTRLLEKHGFMPATGFSDDLPAHEVRYCLSKVPEYKQMNYPICFVHRNDYPEITEVWEASVRATHDFIPETYVQEIKPQLHQYFDAVDMRCIRDDAGRIIGFSGAADGNLAMLFIHPDWFGRGAGKSLLRYAVDQQGATEVDVNEQNEQAVGFYLKNGFEVVGRSETDGQGEPYPLLHMRLVKTPANK